MARVRWAWGREAAAAVALASIAASNALAAAPTAAQPPLVPLPAEIVAGEGWFSLSASIPIHVAADDAEAGAAARYLADRLSQARGLRLAVRTDGPAAGSQHGTPGITFERISGLAAEAYRIEVIPEGVRIAATTGAGLFYGAVTLWQLLPAGRGAGQVAAQLINDSPAHAWRGLLLDSARHLQSPQFVKSMLDWMAWHKLNVLHWHLTDDQGWRLEIRKYPRLTSVGGCRVPAAAAAMKPPPYCGYYTQAQVIDIVA
ncbi:MAG: family 20 glycosylhydrolase, partial [Steroidobacteraceae bacterium]